MLAKLTADRLLKHLDSLEFGQLELAMPDGRTRAFEGRHKGAKARIEMRDWRVISNLATKGNVGFAQDFREGHWDTDNLQGLLELGLQNRNALQPLVLGKKFARRLEQLSYLLRMNTLKGSKKNIHAHYDLGNDFYKLWLDPTMTYSSALYKTGDEDMTQAQHQKYDRITDCLNSKSGTILEIGCGWGGFAERALTKGDYEIKGITLSQQQHEYAQQRLKQKAHIAIEDYRIQNKKYDHIVSIEMFEAVGERFWPTYFSQIKNLLNSSGKAVVQTITIGEHDFESYRRGGDFIRTYIFPGGMLPSPERFKSEAEKAGLKSDNHFFFGQDYAKTLEEWLKTFESKISEIKNLGFDDGFIRLWRFYLAGCAAGFRTGKTNVMQVEVSHA